MTTNPLEDVLLLLRSWAATQSRVILTCQMPIGELAVHGVLRQESQKNDLQYQFVSETGSAIFEFNVARFEDGVGTTGGGAIVVLSKGETTLYLAATDAIGPNRDLKRLH